MFLRRITMDEGTLRRSLKVKRNLSDKGSPSYSGMLKKSNSCSTIFIDDNTVSQPNLRATLKCVSVAIYYHIKKRDQDTEFVDILDEKRHPLSKQPVPTDYAKIEPTHNYIYRFIKNLFISAQLTAECAIISLIYIERLLTCADICLQPSNWKRIVLGAILLASKVWDDQAVWNVDYCQIMKDLQVEDVNELERQFLELIQFNINVQQAAYAKYYFDLRSAAEQHGLQLPVDTLDIKRAKKLEAYSQNEEFDKLADMAEAGPVKAMSLENLMKCIYERENEGLSSVVRNNDNSKKPFFNIPTSTNFVILTPPFNPLSTPTYEYLSLYLYLYTLSIPSLVGNEVWDDQAVWNVDYCQIMKDLQVEDVNELERQFLELIQFNINVQQAAYAKYYFDLRSAAEQHGLQLPVDTLDIKRAKKLEAYSQNEEFDKLADMAEAGPVKAMSLENLSKRRPSLAVIS
eukprot:sb/3464526/